jgi:AraC-like DNA-binding protein
VTARAAAGIACLSESRFSHLFVDQIGLPFRTYVLWRRLSSAVDRMASGASLTNAAHEAGFADSAHFSRTFLRMFGIPASVLLMI